MSSAWDRARALEVNSDTATIVNKLMKYVLQLRCNMVCSLMVDVVFNGIQVVFTPQKISSRLSIRIKSSAGLAVYSTDRQLVICCVSS